MEEDDELAIGLSTIMKLTGALPTILGLLIIIAPKTILAVGPLLNEAGLYLGLFVGVLAILFGVSHCLVATYVTENLHVFGRFYVVGHMLIALLEIYGWLSGVIEFETKYIFGTMLPFTTAFVLLLYSIKPAQTEPVSNIAG